MNDRFTEQVTCRAWICAMLLCCVPSFLGAQVVASATPYVMQREPAGFATQTSLRDALNDLQKRYHISFVYEYGIVSDEQVIESVPEKGGVETVLRELLRPFGLKFKKINDRTYVIAPAKIKRPDKVERSPLIQTEESIVVTGTVVDENNQPLPGVNVIERGTTNGTTTDSEGRFSLDVRDEESVLIFSFIGYTPQEIPVGTQAQFSIGLQPDIRALEEVVVVGYGVQKKVSVTSAVSEVKGEDLTRRPVSNVAQAMQGQLPGLTVQDFGGGPGKSNVAMRVRGITTLSGNNNPLVIVDGIEQRLSDINPVDIESISVLKDASSTAIYGSRAANGVILITTKRAHSGKVSLSYNGFYAIQESINNPEHMGLEDYMRMQNIAYQNVGSPPKYTEQKIQEYVNATDRYKYPLPYTMAEAVLRPAPQVNHSLSLSAGNENFKTRLSLRRQDQQGIIPNSQSKLSEIRLNTDFKVSSKINLATDVNYRYVNSLAPVNEFIVLERLKHGSLWTVPKYPDGTYGISAQGQNALMYAEMGGTSTTINDYIIANIKGDWQILKGLKFTTQFAASMTMTSGKNFDNSWEVRDYYKPEIVAFSRPVNRLTEIRDNVREYTLNNLLNYEATFGNHALNVLAGYSEIENKGNMLNAFRQGFYNNDIQSIDQGTNDNTKNNGGSEYKWGLRSYFGRLNYSFRDKYLFEANGRYDGSSRFSGANRFSFFPSFSGGWRISEEKFWGNLLNTVSELKIRGSWGQTGNQTVALYSYYPTLNLVNYSFNGLPVQGYVQQQMTNKDLSWETTTQSDIGLDAQFLNGRFSLGLDHYNKRTEDILLVLPVPGTLGLGASAQNAGTVDNKGWEFSAGSHNRFGQFGLNVNLNFSVNNNKVIDLAGTGPYISGNIKEVQYITGEGYPINSYWGYKADGFFQTVDEVLNYPNLGKGIAPGDVKYLDLNGDGKINADDMTYLGPSFPKYIFGSTLNMTYKGWSLNLLLQGAAGAKVFFSGSLGDMGNLEGFTHKIYTNNYWTPENTDARFPRPTKFDVRNTYQNDREMIDASYLRLKNIQLMYQLPTALANKVFSERISIYVSGTNLLTFSELNEWNFDPEANSGRVQYYPQTSLYTVGVNLQF